MDHGQLRAEIRGESWPAAEEGQGRQGREGGVVAPGHLLEILDIPKGDTGRVGWQLVSPGILPRWDTRLSLLFGTGLPEDERVDQQMLLSLS